MTVCLLLLRRQGDVYHPTIRNIKCIPYAHMGSCKVHGKLWGSRGNRATLSRTSMPDTSWPNTTCFPFKWGVALKVRKNWEPFVFLP